MCVFTDFLRKIYFSWESKCTPPRNKSLIRDYEGIIVVNDSLIRPYSWRGRIWVVPFHSHDMLKASCHMFLQLNPSNNQLSSYVQRRPNNNSFGGPLQIARRLWFKKIKAAGWKSQFWMGFGPTNPPKQMADQFCFLQVKLPLIRANCDEQSYQITSKSATRRGGLSTKQSPICFSLPLDLVGSQTLGF